MRKRKVDACFTSAAVGFALALVNAPVWVALLAAAGIGAVGASYVYKSGED